MRTRTRKRRRSPAWLEALGTRCVNCGCTWGLVPHHVVYEQHVRHWHGDVDDPDNQMTLCIGCHDQHHQTSWRLPVSLLTNENVRFMTHLFGSTHRAAYYLRRYYDVEGR